MTKKQEGCPAWQDQFKSSCLKTGFGLLLSRGMIEFLSAVADGVSWDRSKFGSCLAFPDNWLATSRALEKRGMIERRAAAEIDAHRHRPDLYSWTSWKLTPAGEHVVGLLTLAGLFVEATSAAERGAAGGHS